MKISEIKRQSLQSLKGNWGLVVLLSFILFIMYFIFPIIVEILLSGGFNEWFNQEDTTTTQDIVNIFITILQIPLSIGVCWFYLSLVRDNNPKISNIFSIYSNGKTSIKVIGATILQGIFVFLWSLLLIIPGIIKSISYSQTFYILRDHPEYTILEAISESRRKMVGLKWKYFLLGLSFIGWGILCLLTLGIGFLWLTPYISTSMATFYKQVINSQDADTI
ncbi:DUF975 family protein [Rummeliibacillus pycnus]|uniref:DUF975 family protein n=1 Tax=Rummeliibacillus pycnus TaxID=101070 RepID=UPI003D26AED7